MPLLALSLCVSLTAAACSTTTAHRVPLAGNPLEEDAAACVEECRLQRTRAAYAACLDDCPGATAIAGRRCAPEPVAAAVCVETSETDGRATALGVGMGAVGLTLAGTLAFVAVLFTLAGVPLVLLALVAVG